MDRPRSERVVKLHRAYVVAFVLGLALYAVAMAVGTYRSIRTDGRFPPVLLSYKPYIEDRFNQKDYDGAIHQLRLAHLLDPAHQRPEFLLNLLGQAYQMKKEFARAEEHYREALDHADFAQFRYNLAETLWERGKLDEAIEHYRQAIKLQPVFPEAQQRLAEALEARAEGE